MKKKIYEIYEKYKLAIIIALIMAIIGGIGIILFLNVFGSSSMKKFENNSYSMRYDNNWRIITRKKDFVTLKHSKGSILNIEIIQLEENYKYSSVKEMIDKLLYDIETQNSQYKLLSKEQDKITKNEYDGYKLLYEDGTNQVMIVATKKSDKLILFTYTAKNDYFDIILDSVQNIIYEFDTVEEKFDLSSSIELKTSNISYTKEEKIAAELSGTNEYEIASNNYYVKYSIPSNFKLSSFNSQFGNFRYDKSLLEKGYIHLNVSIINRNMYEYLDKDSSFNVYSTYKSFREDKDSKFKEDISKLDNKKYEAYIYKNSFFSEFAGKKDKNENVILMYSLNKNHVFIIEISSSEVGIPKEMIDVIKVNSSQNYASFIKINKVDGYLLATLKRFTDYNKNKVDEITLKIPEKYEEIETIDHNIYEERKFSLNYDEKKKIYQYDVKYELTSNYDTLTPDKHVEFTNDIYFNDIYGECNYLTSSGEITLNGKKFQSYDGGYTELGGIIYTNVNRFKYYIHTKVLFYELENGGYLTITVSGNGNQISDEVLNEVTNFDINVKDF